MKKELVISLLFCIVIFGILAGCSKDKSKKEHYTIGVINLTSKLDMVVDGFKQGMEGYGYHEDKNVTYLYQGALKSKKQLDAALQYLITQDVDLLFVLTTAGAKQVKQVMHETDIPIVFAPVLFPEKSGIVKTLAKPSGNITGIRVGGSATKALGWLQSIAPTTKDLFVPIINNDQAATQVLDDLRHAAPELGIELHVATVDTTEELVVALNSIPEEMDSIWLLNSPALVSNVEKFVHVAIKRKLPLASATSQYKKGVLVSYGQDHFRTGEQASRLANKILHGTLPANLPVETADFFLGINMQTARSLAIEIPADILNQADFIVR